MSANVSQLAPSVSNRRKQTTEDTIRFTHSEEIILAICGPVGSGHRDAVAALTAVLQEKFQYGVQQIRISDILSEKLGHPTFASEFDRISCLQGAGNKIRGDEGNSALALECVEVISTDRERHKLQQNHDGYFPWRKCFIIDSIKHPDEYELLGLIYRELFYQIGVFAPIHVREAYLSNKGLDYSQIYEIIDRDSGEDIAHGQHVSDAFVKSDFFIRLDSLQPDALAQQIERYLHLIFGTQIITPTAAETNMHHAWVAAANSACLSRQVGAALADKEGKIISVGWNDVPKYGGGLYQGVSDSSQPDTTDKRCKNFEGAKCFNDIEKDLLVKDIFVRLSNNGLLKGADEQKYSPSYSRGGWFWTGECGVSL